ncbi:LysR substrate-binding domain-containing protein [Rhizobium sp. C4]|uniref:LysR substrate-binding domain-containing protein n=1 Tax=Rhizobium sp. C4 TaxID=1349800 RepID=UPI001E3D5F50|nr:LysR substrate-binding domain-containing protein [Rhizobium sp. C4]MCD2171576.1 LysR substrate-binding domain-containing protein [Rhizobium sp. C4]
MKRGRLPLTALRSFEAAGRLSSFTAAADELHVSQAAISRQIRELEDAIGATLFERHHRSVTLTEQGHVLIHALTPAFDSMSAALDAIAPASQRRAIVISAEPAFAAGWLGAHISDFQQKHPEIEVTLDSDPQVIDLRTSKARIAIRHSSGNGSWPGTQSRLLYAVSMTPVLSPQLLADGAALDQPADLLRYPMLHEERRDHWTRWLAFAGVVPEAETRGPVFSDYGIVLQSALAGKGVALADTVLAAGEIASGRLVRPFDLTMDYGRYWLVARHFARLNASERAFISWLESSLPRPQPTTGPGSDISE